MLVDSNTYRYTYGHNRKNILRIAPKNLQFWFDTNNKLKKKTILLFFYAFYLLYLRYLLVTSVMPPPELPATFLYLLSSILRVIAHCTGSTQLTTTTIFFDLSILLNSTYTRTIRLSLYYFFSWDKILPLPLLPRIIVI